MRGIKILLELVPEQTHLVAAGKKKIHLKIQTVSSSSVSSSDLQLLQKYQNNNIPVHLIITISIKPHWGSGFKY